jgi:rifampicin phosphotransferase
MTKSTLPPLVAAQGPSTVVLTAETALIVGESAPPELGGKGRSLADLVQAQFPIPATGVITVAAYREVAADPDVVALVAKIEANEPVTASEVDTVFARLSIPPELELAVGELARCVGDGHPVAVRSSATVEDLAGSSFAGQYRSFLDVDSGAPTTVMTAVRCVWASLWHPAPVAYRRAFGIEPDDVGMAVVVMKMVPATTAGVVFTVDPGGSKGARVEAVDGLGEALVSGSQTPSAWVVTRDRKTWTQLPRPAARALELALEVEAHAGVPQDVEWAAVGDNVLLVQARPITVLGTDDGFDTSTDDHDLTTAGIGEMVPGVLPAIRWELNRFILDEAFRSMFDSLGFRLGGAGNDAPFVRRVRGRAAIDFGQLRDAASVIPGAAEELESQYFGVAHASESRPGRKQRWSPERFAREIRAVQTRRQVSEQAEVVIQAVTSLRSRIPPLEGQLNVELLAYMRRLVDLAARGLATELGVAAASGASYQRLEQTLVRFLKGQAAEADVQAIVGSAHTVYQPVEMASAAVFAGPTWNELGTLRAGSAGSASSAGSAGSAMSDASTDSFAEQRTHLEHRLKTQPGWRRRRILTGQVIDVRIHVLRRMIDEVIETTRQREATKGAVLELGGEVRRVLHELGRRLVEQHALEHVHEVELLCSEEMLAMLSGHHLVAPDVIRRRRNWLSRYDDEGLLPLRFVGEPDRQPKALPTGSTLTGWAASPGRARAVARVVTKPDGTLEPGEILVAAATDASWSPLFVRAGGVVVERGGPLSHAAILARELGLPAVLNVAGATRRLDGQTVTVDGDSGVVVIEIETPKPDGVINGTRSNDGSA